MKGKELIKARWSMPLPTSEGGDPPTEFRVFAKGLNESENGPCVFDDTSAKSVMEQYEAHGKATFFDYNHGSEYPFPDPDQAVSAGEFTPEVRDGELWATAIKWTERADGYIRSREYRYFSPCFYKDPESLRVMRVISVALTNRPAMDNIAPLVAATANRQQGDVDMNPEELKALNERATKAEERARVAEGEAATLRTEVATLKGSQQHLVTLSATLGVKPDAQPEQFAAVQGLVTFRSEVFKVTGKDSVGAALGVVENWRTKAAQTDELIASEEGRKQEHLLVRLNTALDKAVSDLKLPPAEKEMERKAALAFGGGKPSEDGIAWVTEKYAAAQPRVTAVGSGGAQPPPVGSVAPTPQQKKLASQLGVKPEDLAKQAA